MHRRRLLAAGALSLAGVAGCTELSGSDDRPATPTDGVEGGTATVTMASNYFDPIGLYLKPGDTVEFVLEDGNHSATAYHEQYSLADETRIPADAEPFDSGVYTDAGETFEHTFEEPGTYDYYCIPHKPMGMVGRIVVGTPGGPAEEREIPDGSVPSSDTILEEEVVSHEAFDG